MICDVGKYFEVGYDLGDGIFSVNTIWVNTGNEELEAATETAQRHAERHHYGLVYVKEITPAQAHEAFAKGRPLCHIDDEAERAHDLSMKGECDNA